MKKSIIISIKPKWVEKILNGEKTIEIRKSIPKCDLPIDVYIYCCKSNDYLLDYGITNNKKEWFTWNKKSHHYPFTYYEQEFGEKMEESFNGKIVAKFTLNKVDKYQIYDDYCKYGRWLKNDMFITNDKTIEEFFKKSCLSSKQLEDYVGITNFSFYKENVKSKYNICYAWHIDNLEIFDKPMELSEFYKHYFERDIDYLQTVGCDSVYCPYITSEGCYIIECPKIKIKKAPQSWCYCYKGEE